jgi:hypothetical protein
MTFDEVLAQVQELLQREQRVSYRGLKRRFALDDEYLEDLKEELIGAKRLATEEDGRFLVWTGVSAVPSAQYETEQPASRPQPLDVRPTEGERRSCTSILRISLRPENQVVYHQFPRGEGKHYGRQPLCP